MLMLPRTACNINMIILVHVYEYLAPIPLCCVCVLPGCLALCSVVCEGCWGRTSYVTFIKKREKTYLTLKRSYYFVMHSHFTAQNK